MYTLSAILYYLDQKNEALSDVRNAIYRHDRDAIRCSYDRYFIYMVAFAKFSQDKIDKHLSKIFNAAICNKYRSDPLYDNFQNICNIRNSIVHRGLDIAEKGIQEHGRIIVLLPDGVRNRNELVSTFGNTLNGCILATEELLSKMVHNAAVKKGFFDIPREQWLKRVDLEAMHFDVDMPEHVKNAAAEFINQSDAIEIHKKRLEKLQKLLNQDVINLPTLERT